MAVVADGLDDYRDLHRDLQSLSVGRLSNFQRLWEEVESKVPSFKNLLVKKPKNPSSRQQLSSSGKRESQRTSSNSVNMFLL